MQWTGACAPATDLCRWLNKRKGKHESADHLQPRTVRQHRYHVERTPTGRKTSGGRTGSPHLPHERFRGHGTRRMQAARELRPRPLGHAQGFDLERCPRQSLRNLHGSLWNLQEPSLFRRSRESNHAGTGRMGYWQR